MKLAGKRNATLRAPVPPALVAFGSSPAATAAATTAPTLAQNGVKKRKAPLPPTSPNEDRVGAARRPTAPPLRPASPPPPPPPPHLRPAPPAPLVRSAAPLTPPVRPVAPPPPPLPLPPSVPKTANARVGTRTPPPPSPPRKKSGGVPSRSETRAREPPSSLSSRRHASATLTPPPPPSASSPSARGRAKPSAVVVDVKVTGADTKTAAVVAADARPKKSQKAHGHRPLSPPSRTTTARAPTVAVTTARAPPSNATQSTRDPENVGGDDDDEDDAAAKRSAKRFRARAMARPEREIVPFEEIEDDDDGGDGDGEKDEVREKVGYPGDEEDKEDEEGGGGDGDGGGGRSNGRERHPSPPSRPLPRARRKPVRASAGLQAARRRAADASERVEEARFNRDAQDFLEALRAPTASDSERLLPPPPPAAPVLVLPAPTTRERAADDDDDDDERERMSRAPLDDSTGRESPILGVTSRVRDRLSRAPPPEDAQHAEVAAIDPAETGDGVGVEQNRVSLAEGARDIALVSLRADDGADGAAGTWTANGDDGGTGNAATATAAADSGGGGGGGWYPVDDDDGRRRAARARRPAIGDHEPNGVPRPEPSGQRRDGGGDGDDDGGLSSYRLDWSVHPIEEGGGGGGGGGGAGHDETDDDDGGMSRQYEWATAGLRNGRDDFDAERRAYESHETDRRKTRELLEFAEQPSANATAPPRAMFDRLSSALDTGRQRPARRHESAREEAVRHMCALQQLLLAYFSAVADNDLKVASLNRTLRKIGDVAQSDLAPTSAASAR